MARMSTPALRVGEDGNIEGLDQALDQVRTDALAEGRAQGEAEGYARGRADAAAIMGGEEAQGRTQLAAELAGDAAITPERAESLLAKSGKAGGTSFQQLMQNHSPAVGPGNSEQGDREARVSRLQALGKAVRS